MCVNKLSKVAFDSAVTGIEPATSSHKSNVLTTAPPSHKGHNKQKTMQDEGVIYVAGHPLLNEICARLPGCIHIRKYL